MLNAISAVDPNAVNFKYLVNTHANGDHTYGNQIVTAENIVASAVCSDEMDELPPQMMAGLIDQADQIGPVGAYMTSFFGRFDFTGIVQKKPTMTF